MLVWWAQNMADTSLRYHEFEDGMWVRCNGRGCFMNSPTLKGIAEKYMEHGGSHIVVDLQLCPGVDSTFMGTLAGLARRCMGIGGKMEVVGTTERTRGAMEGLGLDMLIDIDPPEAPWQSDLERRRAKLAYGEAGEAGKEEPLSEMQRTRHVLEAHNTLRSMNARNDTAFGYVCETLQEDLLRHEKDYGDDGK